VVAELLAHGHTVLALARSEDAAAKLKAAGAEVLRGSLEDLDSLITGANQSDGVIHCGFVHDFSRYAECCATDLAAVRALGSALEGSNKPFINTAGIVFPKPGQSAATEDDLPEPVQVAHAPRLQASIETLELAKQGVRAIVLRLPPTVHGDHDHGFVPMLIAAARQKGTAVYIGDGQNKWPAVHVLDAAKLYVLALEKAPAGSIVHATGDEGVALKDIATTIGERTKLPVTSVSKEEAPEYIAGLLSFIVGVNAPTSSAKTQATYGWKPQQKSLLEDLRTSATYFV
jgi:nucleoside-diphosphate-sugar epimerase